MHLAKTTMVIERPRSELLEYDTVGFELSLGLTGGYRYKVNCLVTAGYLSTCL